MVEVVALKDTSGADIDPAKEDGNLATIKDDIALIKAEIDSIKITDSVDNIDEKNAIIVASQIHGRAGGVASYPIRGNTDASLTTNIDGEYSLHTLASLYARDGDTKVEPVKLDTDDNDIAISQKTLLVINLNYVWDSTDSKWVRMTQP